MSTMLAFRYVPAVLPGGVVLLIRLVRADIRGDSAATAREFADLGRGRT
jgi:hypothetical protein